MTQSANEPFYERYNTDNQQGKQPRKCKAYTLFTAEQRPAIVRYASENGNVAAVSQ